MITTEMLEDMLRDTRKRFNQFTHNEKQALVPLYEGKIETLELLISISKEAEQ